MKKMIFLLICASNFCFSQSGSFKEKVEIIETSRSENYKTPHSILFEFRGDTHLIHHFLKLSKRIKREFKKKKINVEINYSLQSKNPWKQDLKTIPTKKFNSKDFECFGVLEIENFKILRKQKKGIYINEIPNKNKAVIYHEFKILLLKEDKKILQSKLEVFSYSTINTKTKEIAKKTREIIL